ncbi:MAG: hypothetical protein WB709_06555 [Solirubrobacteraceae bacterium]
MIAAQGELKNGEQHAVILVPENDPEMIAQMNATMRTVSLQSGSMRRSTQSHAPRQSCAAPARIRPHYCTGG